MSFIYGLEGIDVPTLASGAGANRSVEFVEEKYGELSIAEVIAKDLAKELTWFKNNEDQLAFGYTKSAYWFRFLVANNTAQDIDRLLELAYQF